MIGLQPPSLFAPSQLGAEWNVDVPIEIVRYASLAYATQQTDDPPNTMYLPRVVDDVEVGSLVPDPFASAISLTAASVRIWADNTLQQAVAQGRVIGRAVRVRAVPVICWCASDVGTPLASAPRTIVGIVAGVRFDEKTTDILIDDELKTLDAPLQPLVYGGNGHLDGPPEIAGRPKPICLGSVFNITPVSLGLVDLGIGALPTYAVHCYAVNAISAVRVRGVAMASVSGTPAVGQYRAFPLLGVFQLGFSPDGQLTCDVQGDAVPSYDATISGVITKLLMNFGAALPPQKIDTASLLRLQAAVGNAAHTGLFIDQPITALEALQRFLQGIGGVAYSRRDGEIAFFAVGPPSTTPALTLEEPMIIAAEEAPPPPSLAPLPTSIGLLGRVNYTPLQDVAGSVPADTRALLQAEGQWAYATSSVVARRVARSSVMRITSPYATLAGAQARANSLRNWLQNGVRVVTVITDRGLGAIELGHTVRITWSSLGLTQWSGVVWGWRERVQQRRLELTLVGAP